MEERGVASGDRRGARGRGDCRGARVGAEARQRQVVAMRVGYREPGCADGPVIEHRQQILRLCHGGGQVRERGLRELDRVCQRSRSRENPLIVSLPKFAPKTKLSGPSALI